MKAMLRLTLAAFILAGLTVPTLAQAFTATQVKPGQLDCFQICSVMFCTTECGLRANGSCGCL